jgi:hypothetical protein
MSAAAVALKVGGGGVPMEDVVAEGNERETSVGKGSSAGTGMIGSDGNSSSVSTVVSGWTRDNGESTANRGNGRGTRFPVWFGDVFALLGKWLRWGSIKPLLLIVIFVDTESFFVGGTSDTRGTRSGL